MGFPTLNIKHARSQFLSSACCCAKGAKTGPMAKGRLSSPEARRSGGLWLQSLELPAEVCFRLLPFLQTLQCLNHDTISVHWSRAFQPLCHYSESRAFSRSGFAASTVNFFFLSAAASSFTTSSRFLCIFMSCLDPEMSLRSFRSEAVVSIQPWSF